ncbi:pumilio homolog 12-like [Cornus florida]|uniref:pumilio homolog 12-like n=1 Tax=Cornus florida TaxID=4283 RepID=UPI00289E150B|nr:pumilio homolog 12-like [Cornus florida]
MGKGISELECDEFEKLLGEIPNATSENRNSEESGVTKSSKELKRVSLGDRLFSQRARPIGVNPLKGTISEKHQKNGSPVEEKLSVNTIQQSPIHGVRHEEPNLPDDQSLTYAFTGLSFNEGATMEAAYPPLVNYKSFHQNHTVLLDGQFQNNLKKLPSNMDSGLMVVSSPRSLNNPSGGFNGFDVKRHSQESSNPFKFNVQELKKQQIGYCQPIENFSGAVPLPHGVQGFQFISNVPVHGVEFPIISNQQQYFMDPRTPNPYLHSQQLSQPHITWRQMEEEHYFRMHQQYLYLQQFRDQQLEAQHSVQANGNVATRLMSRNLRQPCNDMSISHHLEQSNQEPFWNKATISRNVNQSNPILDSTDFNTVQVLDKVGKQPTKILTRSNGLNSLRPVKFGSFGGNELHADVNHSGRVLSNGHFHQRLPTHAAGFQLDSASLRGSTPDTNDLKNVNLRLPLPKYNSVDELSGSIYLMAKDQHGCRFLQRKFTEGTREDVKKIFLEIIVHIVELMTDPFGNYLVQKMLEVCDEDQRMQILHAITGKAGDLVRISCDIHGTRAVQKVIETIKTPDQFSMVVSSLKPGIVTLIKNMNGNHVAQRCLQYLTPEYSVFLFEAATANCLELATDRHGCCVLQKCLSHYDGEQRCHLVREITSNALILSQDPYGNYVVQFVFEINVPWAILDILHQLEGSYGDLSMQKYSSNVVEKCLKYAGEERRSCIIQELINNPHLEQIMQDPYGNYVIQAALGHSKGALHCALVEAIRPHVPALRTSPYGKKVLSSNSLKK